MKNIGQLARFACGISHRMSTALRLAWLRSCHDLQLVDVGHIASTAQLDFVSDGFGRRGSISAGRGLRLSHGAILSPYGGRIVVGDNVYVGPYSVLYGHGGLTIGNNVLIAGQCMLIPANHRFDAVDVLISSQGMSALGIVIADDVWIGSGVRVLDGVTIGAGAVVAAGAVVTASVPSLAVVAGVPARVVRYRKAATEATDSSAIRSTIGLNEETRDGHRCVGG